MRFGARDYDAEIGRWTTKDPVLFNGKSTSLYVYSLNDPVNNTDASGYFLDTLVDVGFILYDLYRIGRDNIFGDCDNLDENLAALGADVLGAAIPFATGGLAVRAGARYGDDAFDAGRGLWRDSNGRLRDASGRSGRSRAALSDPIQRVSAMSGVVCCTKARIYSSERFQNMRNHDKVDI